MKKACVCVVGIVVWGIFAVAQTVDFPVVVSEIQITGNVEIASQEILEAVSIHPDDEIGEEDLKAASQAIYDLGWFSEVMPSVDVGGTIVFNVVEYPKVKRIEITGNVNKEAFELFGLTLFRMPIMPPNRIRGILREHGVRTGKLLNNRSLKDGLEAIIDAYDKKGYTLIMLGKVVLEEVLQIEIIEGRITNNLISGLVTIPYDLAEELVDLPLGEPLKKTRVQQILTRLNSSVYFSDVEITPQQGASQDSIELLWNLTERTLIDTPLAIEAIKLEGVTVFPQWLPEATLGEIPQEPIGNYELLQILEDLYDLYYRAGYVMVRFFAEEGDAGQLRLHVVEGRIGKVTLEGNTNTKDYVIMKNLELHEGDVLNQQRLAVSQQRLMALGYFSSVNIVPEWLDDKLQLSVSIVENTKLGGINGSLAFSAESGGLVGKVDYTQKNLLGTGQDLSISYNRGLIGEQSTTWNLGYSTVSFFPGFRRVGFDLYRTEDAAYITVGGKGSVSYPWADYTYLDLTYKNEQIRETDSTAWEPLESLAIGLRYDDVDNPRFPTMGSRRSFSLEKAGGFAAGTEFSKIDSSWIHFSPVRPNLPFFTEHNQVIATRLVLGWGTDDIDPSQAYDFGGTSTIRGTEVSLATQLCYANIEYRIAVVEGLTAIFFFDWGVDLDHVNLSESKSSFGLEFGVEVAGMYARLDIAWVLGEEMSLMPKFDFGFGPMF